jgi:hypothetical protein
VAVAASCALEGVKTCRQPHPGGSLSVEGVVLASFGHKRREALMSGAAPEQGTHVGLGHAMGLSPVWVHGSASW